MIQIANNCRQSFCNKQVTNRQQLCAQRVRSRTISRQLTVCESAEPKTATSLAGVFKVELEYELENPLFEFPATCPPPYKLSNQEGISTIVLTGEHKGERIKILADSQERMLGGYDDSDMQMDSDDLGLDELVDDEEEEEEEEEEDSDEGQTFQIAFSVKIQKDSSPGTELEFDCSGVDGKLIVRNLEVHQIQDTKNKYQEELTEYLGPLFDDLDDQMVDASYEYLYARGIDNAMIEYLDKLLAWKEEEEYKLWLERGQKFLSS